MAYNKAKAELEWRQWKDAEEQKLRQLGVTEETIKKLHDYDWSVFKSDRRFYERELFEETYEPQQEDSTPIFPETADQFLDCIDNEALHSLLISMDKLTIQVFLWHAEGCTLSLRLLQPVQRAGRHQHLRRPEFPAPRRP